jgi:hypothetical protein
MTNPDAHALEHWMQLDDRAVIPLLTSPLPIAEAVERGAMHDAVRASLLVVDPGSGAVVRDSDGAPVLLDARSTDWSRRIGHNTAYTIHPEEVLADNLALLVRRRLGSAAPASNLGFLAAFERALRACAEASRA